MKSYHVMWEIDIEADSHIEAAQEALQIHRDPESIATVFQVTESDTTDIQEIDLEEEAA